MPPNQKICLRMHQRIHFILEKHSYEFNDIIRPSTRDLVAIVVLTCLNFCETNGKNSINLINNKHLYESVNLYGTNFTLYYGWLSRDNTHEKKYTYIIYQICTNHFEMVCAWSERTCLMTGRISLTIIKVLY